MKLKNVIKKEKYEISSFKPGWIKPSKKISSELFEILMFYVVNTPCEDISSVQLN